MRLTLTSTPSLSSTDNCQQWSARAVSVQGGAIVKYALTANSKKSSTQIWNKIKTGDTFCIGDIIHTNENSRIALELSNETVIRLDQLSTLVIDFPKPEQQTYWLELLQGAIHFITRTPRSLKIKTPYVNASVEGTEFVIRVNDEATQVDVIEGSVIVENDKDHLTLTSGHSALTENKKAPIRIFNVKTMDSVSWSLYYPPLFESAGTLKNNLNQIQHKELYTANTLIQTGNIGKARQILTQLIENDPNEEKAYALLSIIEVVQLHPQQALQLAEKALTLSDDSSVSWIALSYAHQANFDLENALQSINQALSIAPENKIALTRQAELLLSLGDIGTALLSAQTTIKKHKNFGRAYSILGFAYLNLFDVEQAKTNFEKAIILDQSDPLPRLGLGLSLIRTGKLKQGRRAIEIAVSLNPADALLRSYLGKAYADENREDLAHDQYTLSQSIDPNDPTPWLYSAILKQSENKPVEALNSLNQSITKNDQRAVYRSRLLLDQDLAARSSSMGRIYNDLGFQQLAMAEAWKSLNADPANHSAHRFLSDNYLSRPRHEIARISELLQSQMLQPANLNPIQPQLTESSLGILDGAGPTSLATSDFTPLFTKNGLTLQLNSIASNTNTTAYDFVLSGLQDRISYSFGQFNYDNDGVRANNDFNNRIRNVFIQGALDYKNNLQFEYRENSSNKGDRKQQLDPSGFSESLRETNDSKIIRLGYRYNISPSTIFLGSLIHSRNEIKTNEDRSLFLIETESKSDGIISELQLISKNKNMHLISGAGRYKGGSNDNIAFDFTPLPCLLATCKLLPGKDITQNNIYIYSFIKYRDNLDFTLGLSANQTINDTSLLPATSKELMLHPKLGLSWQLNNNTFFRAAAFSSQKRDLVANQTLEPTQIAGFNQFFDDLSFSNSRRYGLALDKTLNSAHFTGIELTLRKLTVPFTQVSATAVNYTAWHEKLARAYYYWLPSHNVAIHTAYQYEQFKHSEKLVQDYLELTTQRLPLGINYFHENGAFSKFTITTVRQNGRYYDTFALTNKNSSRYELFTVADLEVGLRLAHRSGKISLSIKNILDQKFTFQDIEAALPEFIPDRQIYASLSLIFQ